MEYHNFVRQALVITGKLNVPDDKFWVTSYDSQVKVSKVIAALEVMPPKTVFPDISRPQHRPITPIADDQSSLVTQNKSIGDSIE